MAFRRRGISRRGRAGARVQKLRWTAELGDQSVVANNATAATSIVTVSDYQNITTVEAEGPTLMGLVFGNLEYANTIAVAHTIYVAVLKIDEQVGTFPLPTSATDMSQYDVLFWAQRFVPATSVNSLIPGEHGGPPRIRAKRKLQRSRIVLLARSVGGGAGNTGTLNFVCRALLKGDLA